MVIVVRVVKKFERIYVRKWIIDVRWIKLYIGNERFRMIYIIVVFLVIDCFCDKKMG